MRISIPVLMGWNVSADRSHKFFHLTISQAISSPFYSLDPPHNNMKNLLKSCVPNPFGHFLNLEPSQRLLDMYLSPQTTQTKQNHCGSITGIDGGITSRRYAEDFPDEVFNILINERDSTTRVKNEYLTIPSQL